MARFGTSLVLAAVAFCTLLPAAEPPGKLETFSIAAVDQHGNPVDDLSNSDLRVFENGKPQQIVSFRHIDTRTRLRTPLAAHEYSNRAFGSVGHATVILFDLLNERLDARGPAWNELVHSLDQLESADGLYLYLLTMNGRLFPVHGLPDPENPAPQETEPWTRHAKPLLDQSMRAVLMARPVDIWIDDRIRMTYTVLGGLASRLAGVPGRKNIVWITHGVPISLSPAVTGTDFIDYTPILRQLSEKLDRMHVSIYPVQQIPPGMAMQGTAEAQHTGLGDEDTLQEFARYTGGRANASNSIGDAIRQAVNDTQTGYQIAYVPTAPRDGKFHKLKIACARKGVRIQVKEGYYAWPQQQFTEDAEQQALRAAMTAPMDASEIGLRATLARQGAQAADLTMRVDAADLQLRQEAGQYTGELKFIMGAIEASGSAQASSVATLNIKLTPAQHDEALQKGLAFHQAIAIPDSVEKVRLAVVDSGSGALGSITVPVKEIAAAASH
jgi:VWFA-related protein